MPERFRRHPQRIGYPVLALARLLPDDFASRDISSWRQLKPGGECAFVRESAQVRPQLGENDLGGHHIDAIDACQIHSQEAMQLHLPVEVGLILPP